MIEFEFTTYYIIRLIDSGIMIAKNGCLFYKEL